LRSGLYCGFATDHEDRTSVRLDQGPFFGRRNEASSKTQDYEVAGRATLQAIRIGALTDGALPLQHVDIIDAFLRGPSDERYSTSLDNDCPSKEISAEGKWRRGPLGRGKPSHMEMSPLRRCAGMRQGGQRCETDDDP
jgi:hypothetical protein